MPGLRYEMEHAEDILGIHAVTGRGASRRREDASRLVQPQRLATQAATGCHLADKQTVFRHGPYPKPCPIGEGQEVVAAPMASS